jgi:hypothetical protein
MKAILGAVLHMQTLVKWAWKQEVERGGIDNCFQDYGFKSKEKNRSVRWRVEDIMSRDHFLFVLLFPLRWPILSHVHLSKRGSDPEVRKNLILQERE